MIIHKSTEELGELFSEAGKEAARRVYLARKKWFMDRIGKHVFRNNHRTDGTHCCEICEVVYHKGIFIENEMHAQYLFDCETEFTGEGHPMRYFDTLVERDEYEKELKQ